MRMLALVRTEVDPGGLLDAVFDELAESGITNLTVLRSAKTTAILFEGWAFDPALSAEAVASALASCGADETLLPVLHISMEGTKDEGAHR